MPRRWIVKKKREWIFVVICSVVGIAALASVLMYAGLSSAK